MIRQNANSNFLYKLHPLQWSVVAILVLNLVVPFAPSSAEQVEMQHLEDMGGLTLINDVPTIKSIDSNSSLHFADDLPSSRTKTAEPDSFHKQQIATPTQAAEKLICYELGPVVAQEIEDELKKILMPKGMAIEINIVKQQEAIGFWVFVPQLRSKALGRLRVEEMKLKGLKDVVLLTRNKPRYSISLGIFKTKKFATQRLLKVQSLGFDAKLEVRYKSLDERWLFVEVAEIDDIGSSDWEQILANYQPMKIRPQECK